MAASSVEAREHAQNLIAKKDEMEAEIKALFEVLESVSELFSLFWYLCENRTFIWC